MRRIGYRIHGVRNDVHTRQRIACVVGRSVQIASCTFRQPCRYRPAASKSENSGRRTARSLAAQGGVNRVRIDLRHQGTKPLEVNDEERLVLDDGAAEAESGNLLDQLRPVQSVFVVGGIVRIETWCLTREGSASAS